MKQLVSIFAMVCGCSPSPSPVTPPDADAGGLYGCSALCVHERDLGCPEAAPTHAGTSCESVCDTAQRIQHWPLDKMIAAPSCSAIASELTKGGQ